MGSIRRMSLGHLQLDTYDSDVVEYVLRSRKVMCFHHANQLEYADLSNDILCQHNYNYYDFTSVNYNWIDAYEGT